MVDIFSRMALGMGKALDMVLGTPVGMVLGMVLGMLVPDMVLGILALDMVLDMLALGMVLGMLVPGRALGSTHSRCYLHKRLCSWQTLPDPSKLFSQIDSFSYSP